MTAGWTQRRKGQSRRRLVWDNDAAGVKDDSRSAPLQAVQGLRRDAGVIRLSRPRMVRLNRKRLAAA